MMNQQNLWKKFRQSPDAKNFEPVYEQTHRQVWTLCFRVLRNDDDALDALQETYARLLALAKDSTQNSDDLDLMRTVCRLAVMESNNLRQKRQRRQVREKGASMETNDQNIQSTADEKLSAEQIRELLLKETETLSDELRIPVQLHFFDGLSQREVANSLGISLGLVNKRIAKAKKTLAPKLKRLGLGKPNEIFGAIIPLAALLTLPKTLPASTVFDAATTSGISAPSLSTLQSIQTTTVATSLKIAAVVLVVSAISFFAFSSNSKVEVKTETVAEVIPPAEQVSEENFQQVEVIASTSEEPKEVSVIEKKVVEQQSLEQGEEEGPGILNGTVYSYDGDLPVDDLTLYVYQPPNPQWRDRFPAPLGEPVKTSKSTNGKFQISGLEHGNYVIVGMNDHFLTTDDRYKYWNEFIITENEPETTIDLVAFQGNRIVGKIIDEDTQQPIANAKIEVVKRVFKITPDEQDFRTVDVFTNSAGEFEVDSIFGNTSTIINSSSNEFIGGRQRSMSLKVIHEDYVYSGMEYTNDSNNKMHGALSREEIEKNIIVEMKKTIQFKGRVVSSKGYPISEPTVYFRSEGMSNDLSQNKVIGDALGNFQVKIPASLPSTLIIDDLDHLDYKSQEIVLETNATDIQEFELKHRDESLFEVHVLNEEGENIEAHTKLVDVHSFAKLNENSFGGKYPSSFSYSEKGKWRREIEAGIYEHFLPDPSLLDVDHEKKVPVYDNTYYMVKATAEDYYGAYSPRLTNEDFSFNEPLIITMTKKPESKNDKWYSGTIYGYDDQPLEGAVVQYPILNLQTTTDEKGGYLLEKMPDKAYSLYVIHPVLGTAVINDLKANDSHNDLHWKDANALLEVSVVDKLTSKPVTDFKVMTGDNAGQNVIYDRNKGQFIVEQSIRPYWEFEVSAEGYQNEVEKIDIKEGMNYVVHRVSMNPEG